MYEKKRIDWKMIYNVSGPVTSPPAVAFQLVQSIEISQAGNAGKEEDFEKVKLWFKNNTTWIGI